MSKPQLFKEINNKKVVSYSPRRLAKAFYCGKAAYHDRFSPGSPTNRGIDFGSNRDQQISELVNGNIKTYSKELEFYVLNTPQLTPEVKASVESNLTYEIPDTDYIVHLIGLTDVVYPNLVVEVKTGKQKRWHEIQALSYAVAFNRRCQIIYITRGYSIFIEPDKDKLIEITRTAIQNELEEQTKRNENCEFCTLKQFCSQWQEYSSYIKVMASLKQHLSNSNISEEEEKETKDIISRLSKYADKYLNSGESYKVEDVLVIPTKDKEDDTKVKSVMLKHSAEF